MGRVRNFNCAGCSGRCRPDVGRSDDAWRTENRSAQRRPLLYLTYSKPWWRDIVNFEPVWGDSGPVRPPKKILFGKDFFASVPPESRSLFRNGDPVANFGHLPRGTAGLAASDSVGSDVHAPCRSGGMADAADSKSVGRKAVWVRLPPPAPHFLRRGCRISWFVRCPYREGNQEMLGGRSAP